MHITAENFELFWNPMKYKTNLFQNSSQSIFVNINVGLNEGVTQQNISF
jgi:hypothetical protein